MNREEILKLYEESKKKIIDNIPLEIENVKKSIEEAARKSSPKVVYYDTHPDITPSIIEFLENEGYDFDIEETDFGDAIFISLSSKISQKRQIGFLAIQQNRLKEMKNWENLIEKQKDSISS